MARPIGRTWHVLLGAGTPVLLGADYTSYWAQESRHISVTSRVCGPVNLLTKYIFNSLTSSGLWTTAQRATETASKDQRSNNRVGFKLRSSRVSARHPRHHAAAPASPPGH